ncbi:MAG: hypothetical protein MUP90_07210 [Gammaproteobacteria bacterium]|nr:hypothetical protein [Gammaproteobacteria bacterium]
MNKMSKWAALYSLTQTTEIEAAIGMMEQDQALRGKLDKLISVDDWMHLGSQVKNPDQANRLLEIAEEWCSFSDEEREERLEEMQELFCLSTETKTVAEAIAHLDQNDEWDDFIDMVNDPEVFEQDGEPASKESLLELVSVAFGMDALV